MDCSTRSWYVGLRLSRAIQRLLAEFEVLRPVESIRATCIGASQYSVQVSGDTLFLSDPSLLTVRNLAAVAFRPRHRTLARLPTRSDMGQPDWIPKMEIRSRGALAARPCPSRRSRGLCAGIVDGTRDLVDAKILVVVLDADSRGSSARCSCDELSVRVPVICVNQIGLSNLDFIDIGRS